MPTAVGKGIDMQVIELADNIPDSAKDDHVVAVDVGRVTTASNWHLACVKVKPLPGLRTQVESP